MLMLLRGRVLTLGERRYKDKTGKSRDTEGGKGKGRKEGRKTNKKIETCFPSLSTERA